MWRKVLGLLVVLVGIDLGDGSLGQEIEENQVEVDVAAAYEAYEEGKYKEAQGLFEKVLKILEGSVGPKHKEYLIVKHSLGNTLWSQGDFFSSRDHFEEVLQTKTCVLGPEHPSTLMTKNSLGSTLWSQGNFTGARIHFEEVLETRTRILGPEHPSTLMTKNNLGSTLWSQGNFTGARAHFEEVLETRARVLGPEHPSTLTTKNSIANVLWSQGNFTGALIRFEEVLETRTRILGPEHPETLTTKNSMANVLWSQGNFPGARVHFEEVLQTRTRVLGSEHPETLTTKHNIANILWSQGDFSSARTLEEEVLQTKTRVLGPEHPSTLMTKHNLASTLASRGDFTGARAHFEKVLQIETRVLGTEHPSTLMTKHNLAKTLWSQGDFSGARTLEEEVLQTKTRVLGPEHPSTLMTKTKLARTLWSQGNFSGARTLEEEVLQTKARVLGPEHPSTLMTKDNLARTLSSQGNYAGARAYFDEVLKTKIRVLGSEHPSTLTTKASLANTLKSQGDFFGARTLFEEIFSAETKIFGVDNEPRTDEHAQMHWRLGEVDEKLGDDPKAAESFLMAIRAAEGQTLRVNASEDERSTFHTKYDYFYQHTIGALLSLDRPAEAFEMLQRYQAQSFQRQLFQRINTNAKVPSNLQSERHRLSWEYTQISHKLHSSGKPAERLELRFQLDEFQRALQLNRDAILEATGQKAGAAALSLQEIQRTLTPGTLVMSYMMSREGILLFTLDHHGTLTVHNLETDLLELWQQVARFFGQSTANPGDGEDSAAGRNRAQLLYGKLLAPAAEQVARSQRVVVIPDGPLHYLPFSALVVPEDNPKTQRNWQYLVEWKPVHIAASASVYAHIRQAPRQPMADGETLQIVAVGDPDFPATVRANRDAGRLLVSAEERSIFDGLARLPHSGREVDILRELYGPTSIEILKRSDATEGRVKMLLPKAQIFHFATHGVVNDERPLDSFIALTIPETLEDGEDNGILQAWELDDQTLAADLVILSACETAMGENRGGEGIISLSRAFQAAGARSVVASLWSVADASTAELMVRFHRHLRDGLPKNEALRQAQIELIRDTAIQVPKLDDHGRTVYDEECNPVIETRNFSHPYHWAAFQLIGDWQ